jgi:hypothetical protein
VRTWLRRRVWVAARRWCLSRPPMATLDSIATKDEHGTDAAAVSPSSMALDNATNSSGASAACSLGGESAQLSLAGSHVEPRADSRAVNGQQFCICDENQLESGMRVPCAPCVAIHVLTEAPCDVMRNILMYL